MNRVEMATLGGGCFWCLEAVYQELEGVRGGEAGCLPNALVLAFVAGLLEAIPMVGPLLGAIPAGLVALSISPAKLIWVIVATTVMQLLENNLLVPRAMRKAVGVNPFVSLLSIFAFSSLIGIAGALMAIPIAAIIQLLLDRFVFHPAAMDPALSAGRDYASPLRYEAQDLAQDLRKQARLKKGGSALMVKQTDQVMVEIEALITDLDALVAYWGGDWTVREKGYLTFNPLKYTHPVYSLLLPLLFLVMGGIGLPGGAVYIEVWRLRNEYWRSAMSLAGPMANLLVAFVLAVALNVTSIGSTAIGPGLAFLAYLQIMAVVLNLIPVPPFDGYGVIEPFLPERIRMQVAQVRGAFIWIVFLVLWFVPFAGRALGLVCYLWCMSQPVKVSDALVLDARLTGEVAERSIAGQIEFWARLGHAIEPLLRGDKALALRRAGDAQPLSECLNSVDSPEGRRRVAEHLNNLPYPHYEPADAPGFLVRIDANGKRTVGRFVNRVFQSVKKAQR